MSIRIYVNDKEGMLSRENGLIIDVLHRSPYPYYMEYDRMIWGDDLPDFLKAKKDRVVSITLRDCLSKDYHLAPGIYRRGASKAEVEKMTNRTYQWEVRVRGKSMRSVLKLRDLVLAGKIEPTLAFPQEETPSSTEPSEEAKEDSSN